MRISWNVVRNNKNNGFSAGCNTGICYPLSKDVDYVWIINNDIELDEYALSTLVDRAEKDRDRSIYTSTILDFVDRDLIQSMGGMLNFWLCTSRHNHAKMSYKRFVNEKIELPRLDYIVGASVFCSMCAVKEIGLWDKNYFLYCEDAEWSLRAKRLGYKLRLVPESKIYHKDGSSVTTDRSVNTLKDTFHDMVFLRSTYLLSGKFAIPYKWTARASFIARFVRLLMQGKPNQALYCLKLLLKIEK
jgi:GT2 family glycosyltransferase